MTLLDINTSDLTLVKQELSEKVAQAPGFFQQAPTVISLEQLSPEQSIDLKEITQLCLGFGLIVVALRGGNEELKRQASTLALALMPAGREKPTESKMQTSSSTEAKEAISLDSAAPESRLENEHKPDSTTQLTLELPENNDLVSLADVEQAETPIQQSEAPQETAPTVKQATCKIVSTPVRSGQQIYAAGGDLIVLAPVSAGAELLADGNIHVYGALRGRALAGVKGNIEARVFCQSQEAELISIAGCFMVDEDLRGDHWKQSVQVSLKDDKLKVLPLT